MNKEPLAIWNFMKIRASNNKKLMRDQTSFSRPLHIAIALCGQQLKKDLAIKIIENVKQDINTILDVLETLQFGFRNNL